MQFPLIENIDDLVKLTDEIGLLPFFENHIEGFSVEENISENNWWQGSAEGGKVIWPAWEWKGPVIRNTGCAYGKYLAGRAVFISREWFPDFANWRRDGYDFDARYDDGLANRKDKTLYDLIVANEPVDTRSLKRKGDYRKGGSTGFDTSIVRLQMQTYVLITDFVYAVSKGGMPYGWGISRYATPEQWFGQPFTDAVYACSPQESRHRLESHLMELFPSEPGERLSRFLG
jgi:hypothetical protein